jgi:hypothetical protein
VFATMARQPRIWFTGAMYPITNRGNRRAAIFYDNSDYQNYLFRTPRRNTNSFSLLPTHLFPNDKPHSPSIRNNPAPSKRYYENA